MDKIYELEKKPWISKKVINLSQLIQFRQSQLVSHGISINEGTRTDSSYEKQLTEELDIFVKKAAKEVEPFFLFNSADERALLQDPDCKLKTYQLQLEHAKKMISDRAYKVDYLMRLSTTRRELLMRHLALANRHHSIPDEPNALTDCDGSLAAIVVVQIWPQPSKSAKVRLEREVLFRADQCLTELRNQFKCQRDYGVPIDLSEDPEQADRIFRGELFKSGFFLIADTFYNDMRDPNNIDLSTGIIDWASQKINMRSEDGQNVKVDRGIGPFKKRTMETSTFSDLNFRLGYPYLYMHQGDCEHLFSISDIRYVSKDKNLQFTKFPFVTATSIGRKEDNLKCYMCKNRPPHWYTRCNARLPVDPFFFCESCFYSFNYDKDKKKIGQFQAYLYTSTFGIPDSVVIATNK